MYAGDCLTRNGTNSVYAGGISGYTEGNTSFDRCCSVISVYADRGTDVGGIAGSASSDTQLTDCYVQGCFHLNVGNSVIRVGGLVSSLFGVATRCYAIADMSARTGSCYECSVGGLSGCTYAYGSCSKSFASCSITAVAGTAIEFGAGSLCASPNVTLDSCYYSDDSRVIAFKGDDPVNAANYGTPVKVNSLHGNVAVNIPALGGEGGFDFENVWRAVDNDFPKLRAFKDHPICEPPEGITAHYGQTLHEVEFTENPEGNTPGEWKWVDGTEIIDELGSRSFAATFEPEDTETYKVMENISVPVEVREADIDIIVDEGIDIQKVYDGTKEIVLTETQKSKIHLDKDQVVNDDDVSLDLDSLELEYESDSAGTHNITFKNYQLKGEDSGKYNPIPPKITGTINRINPIVNMFDYQLPDDLNYNWNPKAATVTTAFEGMGAITVKYKNVDAEAVSTEAPSKVGNYEVYISVAEGDIYSATENDIKVGEFSIVNHPGLDKNIEITESPYVDAENSTYWYKDSLPVEIKATGEGYKISESPTGGFVKSLRLLDGDSEIPTKVYLQSEEGYITEEIFLPSFRWDNKPIKGEIKIGENIWTKVLSVITFGLLFKDSAQAAITCKGDENPTSGVSERQYLITDVPLLNDPSATDEEKARALSEATGWISFEGESITVDLPNGKNIVYARFVDNVGHVTYVSSDGVVVYSDEETSPTEVDKSSWGEPKEINGIMHYIDADGKTSVEVPPEQGIVWLKAESDGTSAWYGFDNRAGVFEPGSRAYVQWLSKNDPEYEKYLTQSDTLIKIGEEGENIWIFRVGVIRPNGERYSNLEETTNLYVQIGDDWNKDDVKGYYIGEAEGESVDTTVTNETCPEGEGLFGVMKLKHFSPYLIYDKLTEKAVEKTESPNAEKTPTKVSEKSEPSHSEEPDEDLDEYDELLRKLLEEIDEPEDLEEKTPIKSTGDINALKSISALGVLTLLSAAYLILRKKKSSQI